MSPTFCEPRGHFKTSVISFIFQRESYEFGTPLEEKEKTVVGSCINYDIFSYLARFRKNKVNIL